MYKWKTDFNKLDHFDDIVFLTKRGYMLFGTVQSEYDDDDNFSGYFIEDADHDHFYTEDILCWCYLQDLINFVPSKIRNKIEYLAQ